MDAHIYTLPEPVLDASRRSTANTVELIVQLGSLGSLDLNTVSHMEGKYKTEVFVRLSRQLLSTHVTSTKFHVDLHLAAISN